MNATHQERNDKHILNRESTRTCLNSQGQTETHSNENDIGLLLDDTELIPNNDNFLYKSKDEIRKESLKKSKNDHTEKITSFSNVNSSAFRQVGANASFSNRVARNSRFPSNQQSFENTRLCENNNGFLSENGTNLLLSSTYQCVQDLSSTGNWLNFDAERVNDVIMATMTPSEAHAGNYNIRNIFNQGSDESYSGRIGSFVTSQEQALDLSCRKNNVNSNRQSKDTIVKNNSVAFWRENTPKSDPLWDRNATASFKCPDSILVPISTQVPSVIAPFDTMSASLTESSDQQRFPLKRCTQNDVSKICRPIPIYPQSINQSMQLGYDQFQGGTLAHQLTSTPYNFHANCPYPASLYPQYYRFPLPWTTFNANNNNADIMGNSLYDKGDRYQLPLVYNIFDHNLMGYSLPVCPTTANSSSYFKDGCGSTVDANAAKMSHLFPFPGVDHFHPMQQDQFNHLYKNLPHKHEDENSSSQSRQSKLVSGYQNLSDRNCDSSQSVTTPFPFDFSCANKQMAQSGKQTTTPRKSRNSKITTFEQPNIRVNWPVKDKHYHSETYQRPWQTDEKCITPQPDHKVSSRRLRECNGDLSHRKDLKPNRSIVLSMSTNKSDGRLENMSSKSNHVWKNPEINQMNSSNISTNITWIENNRQRKERSIGLNTKTATSESNNSAKASVKKIKDRTLKGKLKQDTTNDNTKVATENIQSTLMDKIPGNNLLTVEKINPTAKTNVTIISQERIKPLLGCSDLTSAINASNVSHKGCIRNYVNGKNMPIVCEGDTPGNLQQHSSVKQEAEYKNTDKGRYSSFNCKEYIGSHTLSSSVANQCLSDDTVKFRNDSATEEAKSQTKTEDSRPTNSDNYRKQESQRIPCAQAHCDWTMSQGLFPRKLSSNNMSTSACLDTPKAGMRNDLVQNSYTDQNGQGANFVNYTSQTPHNQTHEAITCAPYIPAKETPVTILSKLFNLTPSRHQQVPNTETHSTSPQNGSLKNTSSTMKNDETIISVDMNTVDANSLSYTNSKPRIEEDKPKAENNSNTTSQFKCKECSSSHHSFSALLQHQSIGCEPKQSNGAAPVHATDCVGNYMRHDAKWVGDKCQCTPCPMCKGIFGSKFRVYTHIQRGCYKEKIMRYKPDVFSVGGLEFGDIFNPTETCKFPCCGFRSEAKKFDGGANGDNKTYAGLKQSPPQKSQIIYVPRPIPRKSKLHLAESTTNAEQNKSDSKHVQENKRHPHSKLGRKFEPRVEMVTQGEHNFLQAAMSVRSSPPLKM